jgi:peptide/nickel transport system substrate-binding protein
VKLPLVAFFTLVVLVMPVTRPEAAAPEGPLTYAFHVTLAPRWLDPGETESAITPFKVLYAIHDALVNPSTWQPR